MYISLGGRRRRRRKRRRRRNFCLHSTFPLHYFSYIISENVTILFLLSLLITNWDDQSFTVMSASLLS
jgi:hypothetical protein